MCSLQTALTQTMVCWLSADNQQGDRLCTGVRKISTGCWWSMGSVKGHRIATALILAEIPTVLFFNQHGFLFFLMVLAPKQMAALLFLRAVTRSRWNDHYRGLFSNLPFIGYRVLLYSPGYSVVILLPQPPRVLVDMHHSWLLQASLQSPCSWEWLWTLNPPAPIPECWCYRCAPSYVVLGMEPGALCMLGKQALYQLNYNPSPRFQTCIMGTLVSLWRWNSHELSTFTQLYRNPRPCCLLDLLISSDRNFVPSE